MKAFTLALLACALSFLFLHKPLARACGGSIKLWAALVFDIFIGLAVYQLAK